MAIEVITKNSDAVQNTYAGTSPYINSLFAWMQTAWPWTDSEVTEADSVLTGKFYFKENVYMQIKFSGSSGTTPGLVVSFHTPSASITDTTTYSSGGTGSKWWQVSMAKGASGFALAILINTSPPTVAKATTYAMFFGKCTNPAGAEKYGAVFYGTNSALRMADEDGAMADGVYKIDSNSSASYNAVLFPLCNPATGCVFKNIYEPKFCPFTYSQFTVGAHVFQAGSTVNLPCLSDE